MRYKSKSISALHIAHRGLPGNMPVRQRPGLERANRERTSGQRRCLPHDLAYLYAGHAPHSMDDGLLVSGSKYRQAENRCPLRFVRRLYWIFRARVGAA
jgi:hypothetical protein